MSERSELTTKTDANAFRNYYYLKEELVQLLNNFCICSRISEVIPVILSANNANITQIVQHVDNDLLV